MQIIIRSDGSFESLAAAADRKEKLAVLKADLKIAKKIGTLESKLRDAKMAYENTHRSGKKPTETVKVLREKRKQAITKLRADIKQLRSTLHSPRNGNYLVVADRIHKLSAAPAASAKPAASKASTDTKSIRKAVGSVLSLGTLTEKEMKNIHWSRTTKGIKLESSQYNIVGGISEKTANSHKTTLDDIEKYLKEHGQPLKPKRVKPFRSLYD